MKLIIKKHPDKYSLGVYNSLVGIDQQKSDLLNTLKILFSDNGLKAWKKKHHSKGLPLLEMININSPLIILSGEVGCGKTALANSIGTPLFEEINMPVRTFETPSNIRGTGMVGEISNRITAVFEMVIEKLGPKEVGIIIIDEADDLATSRSQNQAHHEDRAGLNVLIKQIDHLGRIDKSIAVIMITNRLSVIDPAILRRASLLLSFRRPSTTKELEILFNDLFQGINVSVANLKKLVKYCLAKEVHYSYSDFIQKVGKQAIIEAISNGTPFSFETYFGKLQQIEPSPLIIDDINSIRA